jgi:glucose-6-phosphate isomerase
MSMTVDPSILQIAASGAMSGRTGFKETRFKAMVGLFADAAALDAIIAERGDDLAYSVDEFRPERVAPQELIFGTSMLQPGKVGDEYLLTRGHIHRRADRPEVYFCQSGHGVMHMELPDGTTKPAEMRPGTVVYVPGYWIHRSVNVGTEPFVTTFYYPADAGQDYDIIARAGGMATLIVDDGKGGWKEAPNPRYRGRPAEEQARYMAEPAA